MLNPLKVTTENSTPIFISLYLVFLFLTSKLTLERFITIGGGKVNKDLQLPPEMDLQDFNTVCNEIENRDLVGFDSNK